MKARAKLPNQSLAALLLIAVLCLASACQTRAGLQAEVALIDDRPKTWLRNKVKVTLRNTGRETIQILKPLDGSDYCWHLPFYRFTIKDPAGNIVAMGSRCGNSGLWADTKWPDDYLVVLKPGASFSKEFYLSHRIPTNGIYNLKFEYIMDLALKQKNHFKYPDALWQGVAASTETDFKLEKQDI